MNTFWYAPAMFNLKREKPAPAFWKWFVENEDALFKTVDPNAAIYEFLAERLKKVHESLVFEMSAAAESPREFVISADGDREAFFAVEELADAAPPLPRWKITRFRPRVPDYASTSLQFGEHILKAEEIEYQLLAGRDRKTGQVSLAVRLFMPGCTREGDPDFLNMGFLLLDCALGEYDIETKLNMVEILPVNQQAEGPRYPFASLREHFDDAFEDALAGPSAG